MADDLGVLYTDKELRDIEKKISKLYAQAKKDIEAKLADFTEKAERKERIYIQKVKAGEMTQEEFDHWKSGVVFRGKQWENKMTQVSNVLADTNATATNILRSREIGAFTMNGNYAAYDIEHGFGVDFGFDLYDEKTVARLIADDPNILPFKKLDKKKDVRWNFKNIRSQITQGILQGESIPKIAERLAEVVPDRNKKQMVLHARTAMTAAQNAGRQERYKEAEELGIKFKKVWLATLDARTRDAHADLDGQAVKPDKPFKIDGYEIEYPGDPHAAPEMVYNCRCTMVTELDDYPSSFTRRETSTGRIIGNMSYRDWEKWKAKEEKAETFSTIGLKEPVRPKRANFDSDEAYEAAKAAYRTAREAYRQQKDDIINNWLESPKTYTSPDDVIRWAKENGVDVTQGFLDNVDPKLFDTVLGTQSEMFERFPEVKGHVESFGSAWSLGYDSRGDFLMEATRGLNLGPSCSDARSLAEQAIDSQVSGYLTTGDGTLSTLVRHEYGHNADFYCRSKFSTLESTREDYLSGKYQRCVDARNQYNSELVDITVRYGSEYSRINTGEAFAEGFAEFTSNPNSDYGKAFGRFFERWYYANPIE